MAACRAARCSSSRSSPSSSSTRSTTVPSGSSVGASTTSRPFRTVPLSAMTPAYCQPDDTTSGAYCAGARDDRRPEAGLDWPLIPRAAPDPPHRGPGATRLQRASGPPRADFLVNSAKTPSSRVFAAKSLENSSARAFQVEQRSRITGERRTRTKNSRESSRGAKAKLRMVENRSDFAFVYLRSYKNRRAAQLFLGFSSPNDGQRSLKCGRAPGKARSSSTSPTPEWERRAPAKTARSWLWLADEACSGSRSRPSPPVSATPPPATSADSAP